jgi:dolichol-phosphate mannosyltransferase
LNTSLTVLLPVYNAQQRLADQVERLLDVLPEMSRRFEVVIVDDGSTDDTSDIAYELATYFPQVNLVRHPVRLGLEESIQTGLDVSTGEVVFVGDQQYGIAVEDLQKLWQVHDNQDLTVGRAKNNRSIGANWMSKLLARSQQRQAEAAAPKVGVQMIRRDTMQNLPGAGQAIAVTRRVDATKSNQPPANKSTGPKYLNPIKRFALDE